MGDYHSSAALGRWAQIIVLAIPFFCITTVMQAATFHVQHEHSLGNKRGFDNRFDGHGGFNHTDHGRIGDVGHGHSRFISNGHFGHFDFPRHSIISRWESLFDRHDKRDGRYYSDHHKHSWLLFIGNRLLHNTAAAFLCWDNKHHHDKPHAWPHPNPGPDATPLPGTLLLLGSVLGGSLGFAKWRRRRTLRYAA